jgi:preprotein translocase subunit YajC
MTFFNLANAAQQQGVGGGMTSFLIMMVVIGLIMYFLMIRPQQKKAKQHQLMLSQLKKGDRVITSSGMYGTIFAIQDDQNKVVLKITDEIKVEFAKSSIMAKVES